MYIDIPDNFLTAIVEDLSRGKHKESHIVADQIERLKREEKRTIAALKRRDKKELEELSNTMLGGFNRFRVLNALMEIEKNGE